MQKINKNTLFVILSLYFSSFQNFKPFFLEEMKYYQAIIAVKFT